MLKSKLHRVHVTHSELHYEGSCAIDVTLLEAADIREYEHIHIYNVTNGERFSTYAISGERDSGMISVNGAAAHKANPGDIIIIASYSQYHDDELTHFAPKLVYVDSENRIQLKRNHIPTQAAQMTVNVDANNALENFKLAVVDAIEDIKGFDITVMDVRKLTSMTNYMIVASANSSRQAKAIADNVREKIKEKGYHIRGTEGEKEGEWVLVDLDDIVVHIMVPATRAYYNLEQLWGATESRRSPIQSESGETESRRSHIKPE